MTTPEDTRLFQLASESARLSPCPAPEQLAAFALQMLDGTEQLAVDAHVRRCPLCASDSILAQPADLRAAWPLAARPPARRPLLASLIPAPLSAGLRGEAQVAPRRYEAATIGIELTIRQEGDFRRLTGQVLRGHAGLPGCAVTLRAGRRRLAEISDEAGYFTFEGLAPGRYRLSADDGHIRIEIPDLNLADSDA